MLRRLLQLCIVAGLACTVFGDSPCLAQGETIDAKTVTAWRRAGMQPGYVSFEYSSFEIFIQFQQQKTSNPTTLPCFAGFPNGGFGALPEPQAPFALEVKSLQTGGQLQPAQVEAALRDLARFKQLRYLNIGVDATPAALKSLSALGQLDRLHLRFVRDNKTTLRDLQAMTNLTKLSLRSQAVNTAGMPAFVANREGRVNDADVKQVAALSKLEELALRESQVTDAAMRDLASMPNLRVLDLSFSSVTDAGIQQLAQAKQLKTLYLNNIAAVTNRSIVSLASIKTLEKVFVKDTFVTEEGVQKAKEINPKLLVIRQ